MLNPQDDRFKKFIDKLSQDSWQLELIVSGFSIFGLNSLSNHLNDLQTKSSYIFDNISTMIFNGFTSFIDIILIGLTIHVFIRGLWIAMLGLNFMGGDYDHDFLNYQPKFSNFLKKNLKPLNHYIYQLEVYASSIFGLTFLFAFQMFFLFLNIIIIQTIANIFINGKINYSQFFGFFLLIALVIVIFINFIDFILLGWFKKNKWLAKIYFPIYRLYSWLSFSFLYRPLLYKLIDNKAGKRIMRICLILFIIFFILGNSSYRPFNFTDYFALKWLNKSKVFIQSKIYKENFTEKDYVHEIAINKQVINENYLELYLRHHDKYEDTLRKYYPKLIDKSNDKRGFVFFNLIKSKRKLSTNKLDLYLNSFNKKFYAQIDTIKFEPDFVLKQMPNEQLVYFSAIPTKDLSEGKHFLYVIYQNKMQVDTLGIVPFWYYKP